jgi:hypothetical protein
MSLLIFIFWGVAPAGRNTVQAMVITKYGLPEAVLQLKEVAPPRPTAHQVLVKVRAGSINVADLAPSRALLSPASLARAG